MPKKETELPHGKPSLPFSLLLILQRVLPLSIAFFTYFPQKSPSTPSWFPFPLVGGGQFWIAYLISRQRAGFTAGNSRGPEGNESKHVYQEMRTTIQFGSIDG